MTDAMKVSSLLGCSKYFFCLQSFCVFKRFSATRDHHQGWSRILKFVSLEMLAIVFFVLVYNLDVRANISAVMEPRDPYVEEGGSLMLSCSLTNPDPGMDSSWISIRTRGIIYTFPHVVPLNETTSRFKLDGVNVSNTGVFFCMARNKLLGLHAKQYVHVFRKPEKPVLINCTLTKMEHFECSWSPSITDQWKHTNIHKLKQELKVSIAGETIKCFNDKYSGCSLSMKQYNRSNLLELLDQQACAQVIVNISTLPFVSVDSDVTCWNLSDTIYPDPPEFVGMTQSSDGCLLLWKQPLYDLFDGVKLNFYLTIVPSYNTSEQIFFQARERNITLMPCQPYTKYLGFISSMSTLGGYHSEIKDFTFQTEPTVPCRHVETAPWLMFLDQLRGNILLYWELIPEKEFCGPGFSYVLLRKMSSTDPLNSNEIISEEDGTKWTSLEELSPTHSFIQRHVHNLCPDNVCVLTIAVKNDLGFKVDNLTQFQVVESDLFNSIVIDDIVSEVDVYYTFLSWSTLDKENLTSSKDVTTVVYTCKTLFHSICRNELHWKVININRGYHNLSDISEGLNYGVAVFVGGVSSEIFWSKRNYYLDGKVLQPSQLAVKMTDEVNDTRSMHAYWSFNQEDCLNCSYVLNFRIFYCRSLDQLTCIGNISEIEVANNIRMWEVKKLEPNAAYLVWMASFSRASSSPHTVKVSSTFSRVETKYIVLCSVMLAALIILVIIFIFKCKKVFRCNWKVYKIITPIVEFFLIQPLEDRDEGVQFRETSERNYVEPSALQCENYEKAPMLLPIHGGPSRSSENRDIQDEGCIIFRKTSETIYVEPSVLQCGHYEKAPMLPPIPGSPSRSATICTRFDQFSPYSTINHKYESETDADDYDTKILNPETLDVFKIPYLSPDSGGSLLSQYIDQADNEIIGYPVVLNNDINLPQAMDSADPYVPIDVIGLYSTSMEQNHDIHSSSK